MFAQGCLGKARRKRPVKGGGHCWSQEKKQEPKRAQHSQGAEGGRSWWSGCGVSLWRAWASTFCGPWGAMEGCGAGLRVLGSMFVCGTGDGESSGRESFHPGEKGCEAQRPSCRKENVGTGRWRRKRVAGGWVGRGQGSYLRSGMVSPGACIRHTRSQ